MTKEEKLVVIDSLAEQLQAYPHFYIADIESLNAEQTAALRRKCFESDVKLVVAKNTLLGKALEKVEKADADLVLLDGLALEREGRGVAAGAHGQVRPHGQPRRGKDCRRGHNKTGKARRQGPERTCRRAPPRQTIETETARPFPPGPRPATAQVRHCG